MWAVSQATFMRRVHINGSLYLHDNYGWASGGFLADSVVDRIVDSGSQQQWLSRNCDWSMWMGSNWNMVFAGIEEGKAPEGTWPVYAYTTVDQVDKIQEKPFLNYDKEKGYGIFVPNEQENCSGVSWEEDANGTFISLADCYIALPQTDNAQTMNQALAEGKNLILTPGIYELDEELVVANDNQIVLGMGLATLRPTAGNCCMRTTGEGVIVAGILFDAGTQTSDCLLCADANHATLSDLFFRVGGALEEATSVDHCVEINGSDVVGDNMWVWRADHGSQVGWDINTAKNGIIVNGDSVTIYALMVEHFLEYQTVWNGNNGKVIMYQSECPYDVPTQSEWVSHDGTRNGYASYYVSDQVTSHEAWGIGIYTYNRDAAVELVSVMELPEGQDVKAHNVCAVMITGNPGIDHVINMLGDSCMNGGDRAIIREYENGMQIK